MKKPTLLATATILALLLSGCSAAVSENAKYLEEVAAITEDTLPDVDLTFIQGYGKADYNLEDELELVRLMDESCTYAVENGVIQDGGAYVDEGKMKTVVFPRGYASEAVSEYDAHWQYGGPTYGFSYSYPMVTLQDTMGLRYDFDAEDFVPGANAQIEACEFTTIQIGTRRAYESRNQEGREPDGVVKISEGLYQSSIGDEIVRQFRFEDGLLQSTIIQYSSSPEDIQAYKYTYGMPPVKEQKRYKALLTHRKGLFE